MLLVTAFTILCIMYMFGSWCGKWTKGAISSALVSAIVMLVCFWLNIFPKNIVEISGMKSVYSIMSAIIIANMGTTLDIKQFKMYWRVALTVIGALIFMTVLTLTVSALITGHDLALASLPTLIGAIRSTQIVADSLTEKGLTILAAIIILINAIQQFFGLPMISYCTRKASIRLIEGYRNGTDTQNNKDAKSTNTSIQIIERIPISYKNPFFYLSCIGIIGTVSAILAPYTSSITNGIIGMPVIALILGFILQAAGLIEKNPLQKSGLMPFFMYATIVGLFSSLASLSFDDFVANILNIMILLVIGAFALFVGGIILSKVLSIDPAIGIAAAFGAYTGYPLNYQVLTDAIAAFTDNPNERAYLDQKIAPSVCLGSIISVTITSVIVAGYVATLF